MPRPRPILAGTVAALALLSACSSGDTEAGPSATSTSAGTAPGTVTTTTAVPLEEGEQLYVYLPEAGDCWERRRTDESSTGGAGQQIILKLDCRQPHDNETFGVVEIPDETFPGDTAMRELAAVSCPPFFGDYVGTPYELSELEMEYWIPSPVDWNQTYRHFIACYLYLPDDAKSTRSYRDSGL